MKLKEYLEEKKVVAYLFHLLMIGVVPFLLGLVFVYSTFGMLTSLYAFQQYFLYIVSVSFIYSFLYGTEFKDDKSIKNIYIILFPLFLVVLPYIIFAFFHRYCTFCNNHFFFPPNFREGIIFFVFSLGVCILAVYLSNLI